jgi:hypothetical protein
VSCFLHVYVKVDPMLRTIVPFLILGLLSACNGGEDFSGSGSGPIVPLPGGDRDIPALSEDAIEVELVVSLDDNGTVRTARVTNLGYECTGSRAFIPASGAGEGLARCHPSADKVSFFIGSDGLTAERVYLGTIYLPSCSTRSSGSDCEGGTGFLQYSVADMIPGTAPKRERSDDPRVTNRVSLLAALDANPDNKVRIDIPAAAHLLVEQAPIVNFAASHESFVTSWTTWLANVSAAVDPPLVEPLAFPETAADAEALALAAMRRSGAGTYEIVHNAFVYTVQVPGLPPAEIRLPFNVAEDGTAFGLGAVVGRNTGTGSAPLDFLALESDIFMDEQMIMRDESNSDAWSSLSVLDPTNSSLAFSGRLIGPVVYDGLPTVVDDTKSDYTLDYSSNGIAELVVADLGRFTGTSFDDDFDAAPYRIQRTGAVSAFLHPEVMQVKPQFYRLTIYRACVEADPDNPTCTGRAIPEAEKNLNYPTIPYLDDADEEAAFEPEFEQPREEYYAGTFQVEIRDDGTVVTDSDGNCSPVAPSPESVNEPVKVLLDGSGRREWPVGIVSRTHMPEANEKSMNLALFLAGPSAQGSALERSQSFPAIPHYGTRIEGRINLELPQMPMYRLSDENFEAGVRTIWVDDFQGETFIRDLPAEPVLSDRLLAVALFQGSVEGVALDTGTCDPIAP